MKGKALLIVYAMYGKHVASVHKAVHICKF